MVKAEHNIDSISKSGIKAEILIEHPVLSFHMARIRKSQKCQCEKPWTWWWWPW